MGDVVFCANHILAEGHETPIEDVYWRIAAIRESHLSRLDQISAVCAASHTIAEIYPDMQHGPQLLLAPQAVAARWSICRSRMRTTIPR
jgi:hypothetical protein